MAGRVGGSATEAAHRRHAPIRRRGTHPVDGAPLPHGDCRGPRVPDSAPPPLPAAPIWRRRTRRAAASSFGRVALLLRPPCVLAPLGPPLARYARRVGSGPLTARANLGMQKGGLRGREIAHQDAASAWRPKVPAESVERLPHGPHRAPRDWIAPSSTSVGASLCPIGRDVKVRSVPCQRGPRADLEGRSPPPRPTSTLAPRPGLSTPKGPGAERP